MDSEGEYLKKEFDGVGWTTDEKESLVVAVDILQSTFKLDLGNEMHQRVFSCAPLELPDVFEVGQRQMGGKVDCVSAGAPHELDPLCPLVREYVQELEQSGHFDGIERGSPEWIIKFSEARDQYIEKISQESEENEVTAMEWKAQGNEALTSGNAEKAIELYTKAIELCPRNAVFYGNRGTAYMHLGQFKKALRDCRVAVCINPRHAKALRNIGYAYFSMGRYSDAIEYGYKPSLAVDPTNDRTRADLHQCEMHLHREHEELKETEEKKKESAFDFGNLAGLLQNPALLNMANEVMKDPQAMNSLMSAAGSIVGGDKKGDESGTNVANPLASVMDEKFLSEVQNKRELQQFREHPKVAQMIEDVKKEGMPAALRWMADPEVSSMMTEAMKSIWPTGLPQ